MGDKGVCVCVSHACTVVQAYATDDYICCKSI